MTLLTSPTIRFYFRCGTGHTFERGKSTAFDNKPGCPKCGMTVRLYGLKDDTRYAEQDQEVEGVPGEELPQSGS